VALKFKTTLDDLKSRFAGAGIAGEWRDCGDNKHELRCPDGAVVNWWSHTGSFSFQGPKSASTLMEQRVSACLNGATAAVTVAAASPAASASIFVVHGHDKQAREQLELILHRLDLDPYVLMNTSGGGETLIVALERQIGKNPIAQFGIVLMTPDDMGYARKDVKAPGEEAKVAQARARQNVVLEAGVLLSSLGRQHVAILVKGHVELPSDLQGVIYLHFNDDVREVVPKLAERLQLSGINVTPDKIAKAAS